MHACLMVLLAASGQPEGAVPELSYEIIQELDVPAPELRIPLARVSRDGEVYVADAMTGRVWALSPTGNVNWETQVAPERARSSVRSMELDQRGRLFLVESLGATVHVLEASSGRMLAQVPVGVAGLIGFPHLGAIVADSEGGFFLLSHRGRAPINQFNRGGRLIRELGRALGVEADGVSRSNEGAWIGRGSDGTIYTRPEREFAFYKLDPRDGRMLAKIAPPVPFTLQTDSRQPGDTVFGSAVLPDGRLAVEVTHRRALDRDPSGRATRVALDNALYLINADGRLSGVLRLPHRGLGQFAAIGPNETFYFVTTRQTMEAGQRPRIQVVLLR